MKSSEPMVLLPYSQLEELLKAPGEMKQMHQKMSRLEAQYAALKGQFLELMECFRELQELLE